MSDRYTFISDPGHGWLRVPLAEIKDVALSNYSYRDHEFAYLEEDCDAPKFMSEKGVTFDDIDEVHVEEFNRRTKWSVNHGRI
ncbi:MAG: hypothetical protein KAI64_07235 [Thermoplasmata archaeon]|nr:hypothetical protein [Thermoplasmata archaeon]